MLKQRDILILVKFKFPLRITHIDKDFFFLDFSEASFVLFVQCIGIKLHFNFEFKLFS